MFKKGLTLWLSLYMVFLPEVSFSQRKNTLKLKKNSQNSKKNIEKAEQKQTLSCDEKYNLCMDNVCTDSFGTRTNCDTSIDSFETIDIGGEKFRIGNDLYTFAKGSCNDTLKSCELKERNHIETVYKAKIKEDTLTKNYLNAMNAASDETQKAIFEKYIECMEPFCGINFADCFTIKNVERRAENCSNVLINTSKPLTVKKMFYEKMTDLRQDFCKNSGGYVNYDTKVCNIKISYGSLEKIKGEDGNSYYTGKMSSEVASKIFKVGEIVECTQEYFNVMNTEKPFADRGILDITMGAVKSVAGAGLIVLGALVTVGSIGIAGVNGVSMIANGASLTAKGAASTLNGAVKLNTDVRKESGCFINGVFASNMGEYFKVNFIN